MNIGITRDIGTRGVGLSLIHPLNSTLVLASTARRDRPIRLLFRCCWQRHVATPCMRSSGQAPSRVGPVLSRLSDDIPPIRIDGWSGANCSSAGTMLLAQTQRATAASGAGGACPLPPSASMRNCGNNGCPLAAPALRIHCSPRGLQRVVEGASASRLHVPGYSLGRPRPLAGSLALHSTRGAPAREKIRAWDSRPVPLDREGAASEYAASRGRAGSCSEAITLHISSVLGTSRSGGDFRAGPARFFQERRRA